MSEFPAFRPPPDWMRDAVCAQVGGDAWFPEKGESGIPAKRLCETCDLRDLCLAYAMDEANEITAGVWGGTSQAQRNKLRKFGEQPKPLKVLKSELSDPTHDARCGTQAGAVAHKRRHEKPCGACRSAHSAAHREYRARQREAS